MYISGPEFALTRRVRPWTEAAPQSGAARRAERKTDSMMLHRIMSCYVISYQIMLRDIDIYIYRERERDIHIYIYI